VDLLNLARQPQLRSKVHMIQAKGICYELSQGLASSCAAVGLFDGSSSGQRAVDASAPLPMAYRVPALLPILINESTHTEAQCINY
jgi:hypothetical protein